MLLERAIIFRKRRANLLRVGRSAPGPAALTLVAATYDGDVGPTLRLTFDRAIDIAALAGGQITVDDGANLGLKFAATGAATLDGPDTLVVILVEIDSTSVTDVRLTATAACGIVAVAPPVGGTWPGVDNLLLPFP